jgi:hypothetical protein
MGGYGFLGGYGQRVMVTVMETVMGSGRLWGRATPKF